MEHARILPGLDKIQLTVSVTQSAARKLYASLGFHAYGVEPRALQVNEQFFDEELMSFDVSAGERKS